MDKPGELPGGDLFGPISDTSSWQNIHQAANDIVQICLGSYNMLGWDRIGVIDDLFKLLQTQSSKGFFPLPYLCPFVQDTVTDSTLSTFKVPRRWGVLVFLYGLQGRQSTLRWRRKSLDWFGTHLSTLPPRHRRLLTVLWQARSDASGDGCHHEYYHRYAVSSLGFQWH